MYRSAIPAVTCPECALALTRVEAEVALYSCARCGGAWFDADVSVAVLQGKADPSDVQRRSVPPAPKSGPEMTRSCARCGEPMLPYPFGEVMLDTCPAHGTWFDHDEIARVVTAARKMKSPKSSGGLRTDDVWATAKFAIGMALVPFELAGRVLAAIVSGRYSDESERYDDT